MNRKKRIIGLVLTAFICAVLVFAGIRLSRESSCRIKDAEDHFFATVNLENGKYVFDCADDDWAYVDIAFHEASQLMAKELRIKETAAQKKLVQDGAVIQTCYQKKTQEILAEEMRKAPDVMCSELAGAVCDTEGQMVACYSFSSKNDGKNHVTYPTWAGSSIKPLSVYGPALEEDKIGWSSMKEDSPYMQIENVDGSLKDWPQNTTAYTYKNKTMAQAVKESNNAIAVKTLKRLGIEDSLDWLEHDFHYTVDKERELLGEGKEEEILDNIALGYLEAGVTMKQMLENYQVFATGGVCHLLRTVGEIQDKGDILRSEEKTQQVFSEETTYIMNRMMKGVIEEGGTAAGAVLEDIDLCGKTGTSEDYKDNWFVGMTPEYLCSIWYSCEIPEEYDGNEAVPICREVIRRLPGQEGKIFECPENVEQLSFCTRTGLLAGEHCEETDKGYYKKGSFTQTCNCQPVSAIEKNKALEEERP